MDATDNPVWLDLTVYALRRRPNSRSPVNPAR
jgi:hypothetical protein